MKTYKFSLTRNASQHWWSESDAAEEPVSAENAAAALARVFPREAEGIIVVDEDRAYFAMSGDQEMWAEPA